MAVKPLTASQKKVLYHLALSLVAANLERKVLKPMLEKDGKQYIEGDFRKKYLAKMPQCAQAERALQKAMAQANTDIADSLKLSKGAENGK